jgi:hypothetical protein
LLLPHHISASAAPSASLLHDQVATSLRSAFQLFDGDATSPCSATSSYCIQSPQNLQILPFYPRQALKILSSLIFLQHPCVIISGKVVSLHRFTHARPTSQDVGAATGREHYILRKVFANALFLVVLNVGTSEHKSRAMQR